MTRIKASYCVSWLVLFFGIYSAPAVVYSQESTHKPSRQSAIEAYSRGDYPKAYEEFSNLHKIFLKDPVYNYYSGVCLVKMNHDPENASVFLKDAINGSQDIKSIPDDAWFYLGRSQQMMGRFTAAIESYNYFRNKAGRKTARIYDVQTFIDQCNYGHGKLAESVTAKAAPVPGKNAAKKADNPVSETVVPASAVIPDRKEVPLEYDKVLSEAMKFQVKADSLIALADETRNEMDRLPPNRKAEARARISELESLSSVYQKMADEKFGKRNDRVTVPVNETFRSEGDKKTDEEIYSVFEILNDPVARGNQKVIFNPELPVGLIYRIQMGVFSKQPDISFFRGLSPISAFSITGSDASRYFVGMFRRMEDAGKALLSVKQLGLKDSFITAISDGKSVSIDRAALLENEWGTKPLTVVTVSNKTEPSPATLVFRVEVNRSAKPVNNETLETYKKIAGTREFEIISTTDGILVYLIGKFITFESASEYADLLKRNGFRESRVVSYLGSREIPLETAKQLLEI